MEVVPALRLVEKPMVNASGSPPTLREGEREEEVNFTARENYPGFPTWGRPLDVREAGGESWAPSWESIRKGRVTRSAHIGYYDDTTTASSCHSSCLSNPIGFLSPPSWAPSHPLQVSLRAEGGTAERRGGPQRHCRARGKTRVEGLEGGTIGGRVGVSGREEWRSGKGESWMEWKDGGRL